MNLNRIWHICLLEYEIVWMLFSANGHHHLSGIMLPMLQIGNPVYHITKLRVSAKTLLRHKALRN